jgi:hypothetical protein
MASSTTGLTSKLLANEIGTSDDEADYRDEASGSTKIGDGKIDGGNGEIDGDEHEVDVMKEMDYFCEFTALRPNAVSSERIHRRRVT